MKKQSHKADRWWIDPIHEFARNVNLMIAERVDELTRAYLERIKELEEENKKLKEELNKDNR